MLSALARAIHDDVRNNADQEVNLSSHPPTCAVQRSTYKHVVGVVRPEDAEDRQGHERAVMERLIMAGYHLMWSAHDDPLLPVNI